MKSLFYPTLCILLFATFCAGSASAQCGAVYQYADMWLDDNGIAVGDNYTDAQKCDGDTYTVFADVTVTMPSGASYYASSFGSSVFAEAVAEAAVK